MTNWSLSKTTPFALNCNLSLLLLWFLEVISPVIFTIHVFSLNESIFSPTSVLPESGFWSLKEELDNMLHTSHPKDSFFESMIAKNNYLFTIMKNLMFNKCICKNPISISLGGNEMKKIFFPELSLSISFIISGSDVWHCGTRVSLNLLVSSFMLLHIRHCPHAFKKSDISNVRTAHVEAIILSTQCRASATAQLQTIIIGSRFCISTRKTLHKEFHMFQKCHFCDLDTKRFRVI